MHNTKNGTNYFVDDLSMVEKAADTLKTYLISSVLFWPLSSGRINGGRSIPRELTPGNVLLALKRLQIAQEARAFDPAEQEKIATLESAINQQREQWRTAWQNKAADEYRARLRQWAFYLGELSENASLHRPYYRHEVRNRVLLKLLEPHLGEDLAEERLALTHLDNRLSHSVEAAPFVWPDILASGFPRSTYWYLYRKIR